ncbi:MAG: replication initiation protein [Nitrospirae bacterium]|nr:replication initiation protein [Nitrospirota bacterium]
MSRKKKNDKDALVVKSNYLVEACYRLTLTEQRVILYMVSMINQIDEDFKLYRISVSEFIGILGIEDKDAYNQIRQVTNSLREKGLNIYDPKTDSLLNIGWLSSSRYFTGKGYVELRFDPGLKPYLLQLKARFTSYKLENVIRLDSIYSIRIYELLMQYWRLGERTVKVADLRKLLGITGNEYALYGDFKKRVILTAQAELAKRTDLYFTFTEIKTGRKVTAIDFTITVKTPEPTEARIPPINVIPSKEPTTPTQPPDIAALVDMLPPEHRGKKTIMDALTAAYKEHGKDYVAYNIRYANANCKEKAKYRAFLAKALKEHWGAGFAEDLEAVKQADQKRSAPKKKEDTAMHDKELYDRAINYIANLKAKDKKKLEAEALKTLPIEQQEKVRAGNTYALKGLTHVMEGLVIERLSGQGG